MDRKKLLALALCVSLLVIIPSLAFARAGGGGGGGGGRGGLVGFILLPFLIIHSTIVTCMVVRRNKQCALLLERLAKKDSLWDMESIQARIEQVYFKVQNAWMERDQELCRDSVSDRLYQKHKLQTDEMLTQHRQNMLDRINLKEAKVVEVVDYRDDARDRVWVYVRGSMIDYIVDDRSGKVISGNDREPESFAELWKFVRGKTGWVLDEIDQDVTIRDLDRFKAQSEEV
jgi:predicted lipid-binding transport protein (Tim44 family)